jgi:MerR family redox-sensitive transcriptional activator SoxR
MSAKENQEWTIGELARRSGLAASSIRFYEAEGLISSRRTDGGQRRYDAEALAQLKLIVFAKSSGFRLAEIASLLAPPDRGEPLFAGWRSQAEAKLAELDEVITRAREMKRRLRAALECRCEKAQDCGLISHQVC